ncbi:hypothetical protein MICRO11B_500021 [Micrococcus luteus]|nr:hypothetical protein MICRO11B_500021 [Micrococcus luteus]
MTRGRMKHTCAFVKSSLHLDTWIERSARDPVRWSGEGQEEPMSTLQGLTGV